MLAKPFIPGLGEQSNGIPVICSAKYGADGYEHDFSPNMGLFLGSRGSVSVLNVENRAFADIGALRTDKRCYFAGF